MTALPEPATVTPDVARLLLREIRGHRRPQLLDELKRLYRGGEDAVISRAEILSGELRLQTLDRYLMRLLPIAACGNRSLGWESFRPTMRAVTHVGRSRVDAEVELAFSPENHECVHGPATLVPVTHLAGRLLASGERVTDVERVTWAIPLRQQVRLSMWDATNHATKEGDGAVFGVLRTSFGRAFEFAGVPLEDRPLVAQRDYNVLSQALVAGQRLAFGPARSELTLKLSDTGLAACRRAVRQRPAL